MLKSMENVSGQTVAIKTVEAKHAAPSPAGSPFQPTVHG